MEKKIPRHIAIIMDGNGRWAKQKGLPKVEGHRAGISSVEEAIKACMEKGVKALSLFTFSTENWQRPRKEVQALMGLLEQYLKKYVRKLHENGVRVIVSGEFGSLPAGALRQLEAAMQQTKDNKKLILNLAINYGGREEILNAVRTIALKAKEEKIKLDDIDQRLFAGFLYTKDLPELDLLIRTSGELRLSNFFLWQASYAELYFTPKFWPDFKKEDLFEAIEEFQKRERRFGT
ncbi:MAG: isoprenyl transferase [Candidatus Omnitrophica bacterium]|nr:isoprenyl transferase [Candidatus Omnitrophota bacterium]